MNKQILGAKKAAEEQSKPYKDRVAKLERELKDFVTEHRADMGKTKTRALTFGEVGFRLSTSVSLPRAKEKIEEIIQARRFLGKPTSKKDREELLKLTTPELASAAQALGAAVHLRQQMEIAEFTRGLIEQQKAAQEPQGGPLPC